MEGIAELGQEVQRHQVEGVARHQGDQNGRTLDSGRDRRLEMLAAPGLIPRVTPLPGAEQKATAPLKEMEAGSPSCQDKRQGCIVLALAQPGPRGRGACFAGSGVLPGLCIP